MVSIGWFRRYRSMRPARCRIDREIPLTPGDRPMMLPQGATVAVADGEKLVMFQNDGDERAMKLRSLPAPNVESGSTSSGASHHSSAANPNESQAAEDCFASGTASLLNRQVLDGSISNLVVIAAPRTLGELRKHYHKALTAVLIHEIAKDLTGHSLRDIEKTLAAA
jgi:protein required for attachment to host cells